MWPVDQPKFWTSTNEFKWRMKQNMIFAAVGYSNSGLASSVSGIGLNRFDGGGSDQRNANDRAYHWYPPSGLEQSRWDEPSQSWLPPVFQLHLEVEKSEEVGFWYCTRMGERPKSRLTALNAVKIRLFIDGIEVTNPPQEIFRGAGGMIFHRDEYFFESGSIDVEPYGEQIDD